MSDFNSSLPIRTENAGDVIVKLADATTPSQQLAIDSSGKISVKLDDGSGNSITSQSNGGQRALDVGINVAGVQVDPRDVRALTAADVVTAEQGTSPWVIGDGGGSITVDGSVTVSATDLDIRNLVFATDKVDVSGSAITATVSATDLDIRDLAFATDKVDVSGSSVTVSATDLDIRNLSSAQDSVTAIQGTSPWITKDQSDGPVTPGAVASFSSLMGGQYNATLPTVADGEQVALQLDSSGRLITTALAVLDEDHNYGTVGANTLRTAAQIGNATGAADFNAGATGAQTLRVVANQGAANATPWNENIAQIAGSAPSASNALPVQISTGGSYISSSNPLPVTIDPAAAGSTVDDYKDASAIAAGASDNHDYTVTALKTLYLQAVECSGSGKAKMQLQVETGVASGTFVTKGVQFNSTASPNMRFELANPIQVAAGVRVRVIMSNRDLLAQDLYSTIMGYEV